MYIDKYSEELSKKLSKLKKKDPAQYIRVDKKIKEIINNPKHNYKNLKYNMSIFNRVHIGSFVLIFRIYHKDKIIWFDDYGHHDKIYK